MVAYVIPRGRANGVRPRAGYLLESHGEPWAAVKEAISRDGGKRQASTQTPRRGPVSGPLVATGRWLRRAGVLGQILSLLIVAAIFAIGTRGRFLSLPNLQVILSLAAIPAIIAIGLHQVVVLGGIDLSVEGVVALCVVFVGLLLRNKVNTNDIGLWIVPIALVVGGLAGLLNGIFNTKLKIPSFIGSLGLSWILWGLAVFVSRGQTVALLDTRLQVVVTGTFFGVPIIAIIAIALAVILQIVQDRTRFGRYLYAIGGDEVLAKQAGVKIDRLKIAVFTIAGLFYGLSALLLCVRLGSSQAITGNNLLFPASDRGRGGRCRPDRRDRRLQECSPRRADRNCVERRADPDAREPLRAGRGERGGARRGGGADHRQEEARIHQVRAQ